IVMMVYEDVVEEEAKVDDIVMMAYEDDVAIDTVWYLDTAASNHMCGDKLLFVEMKDVADRCVLYTEFEEQHYKFGKTYGKGILRIHKGSNVAGEG
ncbi:hypothetical protein Tco_0306171, partial [Tanacetum coccineum]